MTKHERLPGRPLPVKEGVVKGVAFSPDGKTLAAGFDRGVVLWDMTKHERLSDKPLPVLGGDIRSIAFSPDGKFLAAGLDVGSIADGIIGFGGVAIWDVIGSKVLTDVPLFAEKGGVTSVAFSPDGKTIAAGTFVRDKRDVGGDVELWDVATRKRVAALSLNPQEGDVKNVAFIRDGKLLAAGYDQGVVLWNTATRERLSHGSLPVQEGFVHGVAFSPDGTTLATGVGPGPFSRRSFSGVLLWDTATRNVLAGSPLFAKEAHVTKVAYSPDGKILAAGFSKERWRIVGEPVAGSGVLLWDVTERNRVVGDALSIKGGNILDIAFDPGGKVLAAGVEFVGERNHPGGVVLWDAYRQERLVNELLTVEEGTVRGVAFSPDRKTLAAGYATLKGGQGGVVLWDTSAYRRMPVSPLHVQEDEVTSVAFSPDGKTLAAGLYRGVVPWDVVEYKRRVDKPLPNPAGDPTCLAFSTDGKTLAVGTEQAVVLWDVTAMRRVGGGSLPVPEGQVTSVAFSPDGKTLAAGLAGFGGRVVLWDAAAHRRLLDEPLVIGSSDVDSVVFSPDGKTLAAGTYHGVLLVDLDPESWIRKARQIANRNFTREEWKQYFPDEPYRPTCPDLPVPPE